jgi:hypothetical protein
MTDAGLTSSATIIDAQLQDESVFYIVVRCTSNTGFTRTVGSAAVYVQALPAPVQFVYIGPAAKPTLDDLNPNITLHAPTTGSLHAWFSGFDLNPTSQVPTLSYKWALGKTTGGAQFVPFQTLRNDTSFTTQLQQALQTYGLTEVEGRKFFLTLLTQVRLEGEEAEKEAAQLTAHIWRRLDGRKLLAHVRGSLFTF